MLVIIEGPRNTGKSTLSAHLKEVLGERGVVLKFQKTESPHTFMTNFLTKNFLALIDSRVVYILDRFSLTEYVMRSLDKKVDIKVLKATTQMIDTMLKNMGALTVVLTASEAVRIGRIPSRDTEHRKPEWYSYTYLDKAWDEAIKLQRSQTFVLSNETKTDEMNIIKRILATIKVSSTVKFNLSLHPWLDTLETEDYNGTKNHSLEHVGVVA